METIRLIIDGKEIETPESTTVLTAALSGGIYIPHLCHHPDLRPVGKCGLCVVEIEGLDEQQSACITTAAKGMRVITKSPAIDEKRRHAMELLLADHPPECLACSQYLNCELQSVKQYLGISEELSIPRRVKKIPEDRQNPLFVHDFTRCICCERCVRACDELRGVGILEIVAYGEDKSAGVKEGQSLIQAGCRFCGACVEVCPTGAIRDKEELLEGKKRRQALIPCKFSCPAEIDVPRYVRLVGRGKYAEATAVIREKVPFPLTLGHICTHPCESGCRRGAINAPISIRNLKRFAVENDARQLWKKNRSSPPATDHRVAVIGSGPAGLTVAYYLARLGHSVTVYEAMPLSGGMLRYGIPEYRLPRAVLDSEIREIVDAGVTIETETRIEDMDELLLEKDFDAVVVAVGAHVGIKIPLPGADLPQVLLGTDFLRKVNQGQPVQLGKKIVVLGGGNVAFDCARVARRLGVTQVEIACLEVKEGMPAACDEIEQGEEEGIAVHPALTFTRIVEDNGKVAGVECLCVAHFEFDEEGRPEIETVPGSQQILTADTVIFAIGQRPEIPQEFDLDLTERGFIEVDPYLLDTSSEGVFAAGDAVNGTSSVIKAIASGRKVAMAVDRHLGGDGTIDEQLIPKETIETCIGAIEGFAQQDRCKECCLGVDERLDGFCQIVQAMDEPEAVAEAKRCLRCDLRLTITPISFWGNY